MKVIDKRLLLIEPPFYRLFNIAFSIGQFPLNLGYLSNWVLKETQWKVTTYNAEFHPAPIPVEIEYLSGEGFENYLSMLKSSDEPIWDEVRAVIEEYRPTVVGISSKTQSWISALNVITICKQIIPDAVIIVGGPHASLMGKQLIEENQEIDISVVGEGEHTLVETLDALESGSDLKEVRGIVFRDGEKAMFTGAREYIQDLDSLPFPFQNAEKTLKDYDSYLSEAFSYVFATRGCPYGCTFCSSRNIWSRKVRFRSPENVASEIAMLCEKGIKKIHFHDDTFGVNRQYIQDLCNAIQKAAPDVLWSCEIHANLIDKNTVSTMKKAGCYMIQVGIESGNNEMLRKIKKGIKIEDAFLACQIIKEAGILLNPFFMVGFPDETLETLADTRKAMQQVHADFISFSIFTPYPGTDLFEHLLNDGTIGDDFNVSLYNHQSPENHFCKAIPKEKFKKIALEIGREVDRINRAGALKLGLWSPDLVNLEQYACEKELTLLNPDSFNIVATHMASDLNGSLDRRDEKFTRMLLPVVIELVQRDLNLQNTVIRKLLDLLAEAINWLMPSFAKRIISVLSEEAVRDSDFSFLADQNHQKISDPKVLIRFEQLRVEYSKISANKGSDEKMEWIRLIKKIENELPSDNYEAAQLLGGAHYKTSIVCIKDDSEEQIRHLKACLQYNRFHRMAKHALRKLNHDSSTKE